MNRLPHNTIRLLIVLSLTICISTLVASGSVDSLIRSIAATAVKDKAGNAGTSLNAASPPLVTEIKLIASDGAPRNNFGSAVAVSGNTAVVGDNNAVYVFVRSNGIWAQQEKLSSAGSRYLAVDGNTIVSASGNQVTVFVRNGATWTPQQLIALDSGTPASSVSISGDTIVVGISSDRDGCSDASRGNRGAALVFVRNSDMWTRQQKLVASDGQCGGEPSGIIISAVTPYIQPGDFFGDSVSISGDTILVGAYGAAVGTNVEAGAAYVFERNGGLWAQQQKLLSSSLSLLGHFGDAVAISNDTAVIGATGDNGALMSPDQPGSAYVFGRSNGTWTAQQHFAGGGASICSYSFGGSVAVSGDTIVVSCNCDLPPASPISPPNPLGSAAWFKRSGSSWIQQPKLMAGDGVQGDNFGNAVAISGSTIVVGAYRDDTPGGIDAGSAYVFQDGDIDTTPPSLTVPSTINVEATSPVGIVVNYLVSATDNLDPNPRIDCAPASGSVFPIGTTIVNCTTTDASDNSASDSFDVNVAQAPPPPPPSCTPAPDPIPLPLPPLPNGGLRRMLVMGQSRDRSGYGHFLYEPGGEVLDKNPCQNIADGKDCPKPNVQIIKESGATWVRLWADWPTYQPADPPQPPGNLFPNVVDLENTCADNYVDKDPRTRDLIKDLDEQIMLARSNGLRIILTANRFPVWANYPKSLFSSKPLSVVPDDVGVDSPWGKWIQFLVKRYGYSETTKDIGRFVDFLEITNEPNLDMLPQRGMPEKVARMFQGAQAIVRKYGNTLRLAGPGTSDIDHSTCQADKRVNKAGTNYAEFTEELLKYLRRIGFVADENFAWSHHNYRDVECDKDGIARRNLAKKDFPNVNSAAWVRWMIVAGDSRYRWAGWPDRLNPQLLITEGGARLDGILNKYPDLKVRNCRNSSSFNDRSCQQQIRNQQEKQRSLVERNFLRMSGMRDRRLGEGIALVSSYLTYTDPTYDSGLFDYIGPCTRTPNFSGQNWRDELLARSRKRPPSRCTGEWGKKRLVYDKWKSLPSGP